MLCKDFIFIFPAPVEDNLDQISAVSKGIHTGRYVKIRHRLALISNCRGRQFSPLFKAIGGV